MPKVQITKEMMLEAGLKLLIEGGTEGVTIKNVAEMLGCSTQPISWTFGNMEGFKGELSKYALEYVNRKLHSDSVDAMQEYGKVGRGYIDLAFDEPNLVRFLRSDEKALQSRGGFGGSFDANTRMRRQEALAKQFEISIEDSGKFMTAAMIYTQGLVSMIIVGGLEIDKETAYQMIDENAEIYIKAFQKNKVKSEGLEHEKIK